MLRTAFIQQLIQEARYDSSIVLVVGDLGYSVVEPFQAEFPDRFLNAGVSEQSMTGLAAGLASEGFHVFTYSIGNFPTLRCLEQIRNDVCYHQLPVTVVAVGAGMSYGNLGYSHHCIQDIACLRGMPHLTLLSPADPGETRACVKWLTKRKGPSYLRLGKAGEPDLHDIPINLERPLQVVNRGAGLAIVASGSILGEAMRASVLLEGRGIECDVFSMTRLAPTASTDFCQFQTYRWLVTVEEHVPEGGLGEMIAAAMAGRVPLLSRSVPAGIAHRVGSQHHLRSEAGLDAASLAAAAERFIRNPGNA
jgi:transketolase